MTGKLIIVWFVLLLGTALLPSRYFSKDISLGSPGTVEIVFNECGCECPDASIVNGELIIPGEILRQHPETRKDMINIINRDVKNLEVPGENRKFVITCEVASFKEISCSPQDCLVVPVVNVTSWGFVSYVPLALSHTVYTLLFVFLIGSSTLISLRLWASRN